MQEELLTQQMISSAPACLACLFRYALPFISTVSPMLLSAFKRCLGRKDEKASIVKNFRHVRDMMVRTQGACLSQASMSSEIILARTFFGQRSSRMIQHSKLSAASTREYLVFTSTFRGHGRGPLMCARSDCQIHEELSRISE